MACSMARATFCGLPRTVPCSRPAHPYSILFYYGSPARPMFYGSRRGTCCAKSWPAITSRHVTIPVCNSWHGTARHGTELLVCWNVRLLRSETRLTSDEADLARHGADLSRHVEMCGSEELRMHDMDDRYGDGGQNEGWEMWLERREMTGETGEMAHCASRWLIACSCFANIFLLRVACRIVRRN